MKNYLKVNYGQPNVIKKNNNKKLYVLLVPFSESNEKNFNKLKGGRPII